MQAVTTCDELEPQLIVYHTRSSPVAVQEARKNGRTTHIPLRPRCKMPALPGCLPVDVEHLVDQLRTFGFGFSGMITLPEGGATQLRLDDPEDQKQAVWSLVQHTLVQTATGEESGSAKSAWFLQAAGASATEVLASSSHHSNPMHLLSLLALLLQCPVRVLLPKSGDGTAAQQQQHNLLILPPGGFESPTNSDQQQHQQEVGEGVVHAASPGDISWSHCCIEPTTSEGSCQPTTSSDCSMGPWHMEPAHTHAHAKYGSLQSKQASTRGKQELLPVKREPPPSCATNANESWEQDCGRSEHMAAQQLQADMLAAQQTLQLQGLLQESQEQGLGQPPPQNGTLVTLEPQQHLSAQPPATSEPNDDIDLRLVPHPLLLGQQQQQSPPSGSAQTAPPGQLLLLRLWEWQGKWRIDVMSCTPVILQHRRLRKRRLTRSLVVRPAPNACCACSKQQPLSGCLGAFCAYSICQECARVQYAEMSRLAQSRGVLWCAQKGWLCKACVLHGKRADVDVFLKPMSDEPMSKRRTGFNMQAVPAAAAKGVCKKQQGKQKAGSKQPAKRAKRKCNGGQQGRPARSMRARR